MQRLRFSNLGMSSLVFPTATKVPATSRLTQMTSSGRAIEWPA
jgi:hypothetical protein